MNWFNIVTLVIAGWGAVLSTWVAIWQWRHSGPRLHVTTTGNMVILGGLPAERGKKIIVTEAVNRGDRSTTITNLCLEYYPQKRSSIWRRERPLQSFVIKQPSTSQAIPHKLEPGERWLGEANQNADIVKMSREGRLYFVLYHSHSDKGVKARLTGSLLD